MKRLLLLAFVVAFALAGCTSSSNKEFTRARRNARTAGNAPNANQRISEANQALGFLTTAKNDIIDP
jgi:hypothetical protein